MSLTIREHWKLSPEVNLRSIMGRTLLMNNIGYVALVAQLAKVLVSRTY
jgi:hypothetical protein